MSKYPLKPKDVDFEELRSLTLFIKPLIGLIILLSLGTFGYMIIEGWNWLDSLFMSVITFTTVGYGTVHPLSHAGQIFTMLYILFGVVLFLYFAAEFAEYIITVNFGKILGKRKMRKKLSKLKEHYLVCGYGRTGAEITSQLKNSGLDFVVIEKNNDFEEIAQKEGFLYVLGDATDDDTLKSAGILEAKGIFCALSDDVDNLYLTLSAKNINPRLTIVARCIKASNEPKFKKAGAKSIILPYEICGRRMVASVVKPFVVDFLDVVMHTKGRELELTLEQFMLKENSVLIGKSIISSGMRQQTGVIIIAIKREDEYITNPTPTTVLQEKDVLIALGATSELSAFEELYL
ncbi:MAG: potassium channel protein [bacterium]